jgi:hypothetical protein
VEELQALGPNKMNQILRDYNNFSLHLNIVKGSSMEIDLEKMVGFFPFRLLLVGIF